MALGFIDSLYRRSSDPRSLKIAKAITASLFLLLMVLYVASVLYNTIEDVPAVRTLFQAKVPTMSLPRVYLCPNSNNPAEDDIAVSVSCQYANLVNAAAVAGPCPSELSNRSLSVVKSAGWNTQRCTRIRLDQATDANGVPIVFGNPQYASFLTGSSFTSGVTINVSLTSSYPTLPSASLGIWVFPADYDPEDDDPNSRFNMLTDAPNQYDSPIGDQFVLSQGQQMFLFYTNSSLTYTRHSDTWVDVIGLPGAERATITELTINPIVFALSSSGVWGQVTVQPASYTVEEKQLQRNFTVLSILALVGGNFGFWTALFVILYGQQRLSPWGVVQNWVPSIRTEIRQHFAAQYGSGPEQPLVGPDITAQNLPEAKIVKRAAPVDLTGLAQVVDILTERVQHLEGLLAENYLNIDYLQIEQQRLARRQASVYEKSQQNIEV